MQVHHRRGPHVFFFFALGMQWHAVACSHEVIYRYQYSTPQYTTTRIGRPKYLHSTSMGPRNRVLLSYMPPLVLLPLPQPQTTAYNRRKLVKIAYTVPSELPTTLSSRAGRPPWYCWRNPLPRLYATLSWTCSCQSRRFHCR